MRLGSFVAAVVLCWPAFAFCQNSTRDLLATIHDEESLVTAIGPLAFEAKPLDMAALRAALDDREPHVRWAAAMTLAWHSLLPELAVPVLVDAIKHGGTRARRIAFGGVWGWLDRWKSVGGRSAVYGFLIVVPNSGLAPLGAG